MSKVTLKRRTDRKEFEVIESHEFKDFMEAVKCYNKIFREFRFDDEQEEIMKGGTVRCYNRHTKLMIEFI